MERMFVSGVAQDKKIARIALIGLSDEPGVAYRVFALLARQNINVDIILQSIGRGNTKDISFTVAEDEAEVCRAIFNENKDTLRFDHFDISTDIAKISIVGAGMATNPGVASQMFEALYEANINIRMISTSEIKVSVLVSKEDSERAVRAIHDKFFH